MASIKANCRKVMCIGRNYAEHITELNNTRPKQPFFFLKPPSSILITGSGPILRPPSVSLHYEVELGLIIGKTLRDLDPNDEKAALDAIDCGWFRLQTRYQLPDKYEYSHREQHTAWPLT
ncbi:hypothetical protein KEM56_001898 [Ascosphaera pollenicola]|nr:hypothetical protein KEM56_001898 [Ascosphaera pollenicola]